MQGIQTMMQPRKKALAYLGVFAVVIILLTMLTTTLHTLSIAQVETVKPQRTALTRTLESHGVVKAEVESPFFIDSLLVQLGIFVDQVMVYDGQLVSVGDPIIKLNIDQLKRALSDAELELTKQQLISEKSHITANIHANNALDEEKTVRDAQTAARDRESNLENADKAILLAQEALTEAVATRNQALYNQEKAQSRSVTEAFEDYQQGLDNAQDKVNQASLALSQAQTRKGDALLMAQRWIDDCIRVANDAQAALALSPDDATLQKTWSDAQIALDRAYEDYDLAVRDSDNNISITSDNLSKAQQQMAQLQAQGVNPLQAAVDAAQIAYEQAEKAVVNRQRDVDDAKKAKADVIAKADDEIWQEEYNRKISQEAQRILAAQEAAAEKQSDIDNRLQGLEQQNHESKVNALREIIASDGIIYAAFPGVITRIEAQSGSPISSVAVRIAQNKAGLSFVCRAEKSQSKYFIVGDTVILKNQDQEDIEVPIYEIKAVMEDEELVDIIVRLDSDEMNIGATATLRAEKKTSVYDCVIPIEALRSDGNGYFVLVARENKGGWGAKLYAERVKVTVLAQDYKSVAVEGVLQFGDACISKSNKALNDGDGVQGARQ